MLNYGREWIIYFLVAIKLISCAAVESVCEESGVISNPDGTSDINIRFPHITTTKNDEYLCTGFTGFSPDKESYILNYIPKASQENVHHMILYGCSTEDDRPVWECGMGLICPHGSKTKIMYAWARDAQQLQLPHDVGFKIGKDAGISSLVLQVHYAHPIQGDCSGLSLRTTHQPQKYSAGIYLLGSSQIMIPPHKTSTSVVTCRHHSRQPLQVFAFRTHTHNLGVRVVGYRRRDGKTKVIGSGNPLWPQAFYPRVGGNIELVDNDVLMGRCDYKSDNDKTVTAGMTGDDEMCNFYMMYYTMTSSTSGHEDLNCWNDQLGGGVTFPQDQTTPPFPGYGGLDSIMSIVSGESERPSVPPVHHHSHQVVEEDVDDGHYDVTNPQHMAADQQVGKSSDPQPTQWPVDLPMKLGQIGGVDVDDQTGLVHIFQRGSRIWDASSFVNGNIFAHQDEPIHSDTIVVVDGGGKLVYSWGKHQFYMPHGITVVGDDVWVTDVALHQALKFPIRGATSPLMALGERFQPGNDNTHFCKPTSVAVDPQGNIYVADGYCNTRIVHFDPHGDFVKAWGKPTDVYSLLAPPGGCLNVVHDIKYIPLDGSICVADRENGRVQCFDREKGNLRKMYENKQVIGKNIYAIDFANDGKDGRLYMVNHKWGASHVVEVNYKSGEIMNKWSRGVGGEQLKSPHALAISTNRQYAFVGQIEGKSMMKVKLLNHDTTTLGQSLVSADGSSVKGDEMSLLVVDHPNNNMVDDSLLKTSEADKLIGGGEVNKTKVPTSGTSKNVLILLLLTILPLIAVVLSIFYFISRNRQMKDYKRLMFEDEDWVNDDDGGKLNIGKMLSRKNSGDSKHKLLKPKNNGEDEGLMNGVDEE